MKKINILEELRNMYLHIANTYAIKRDDVWSIMFS